MKDIYNWFDLPPKDMSVDELIKFITSQVDKFVPAEFKDSATVSFREDDCIVQLFITYKRPYTKEEEERDKANKEDIKNRNKANQREAALKYFQKYPEEVKELLDK